MHKRLLIALTVIVFFTTILVNVYSHDVIKRDVTNGGGILYTQPVNSVLFTHQSHIAQKLTCADCHSGLFEMEALKVQEKKDFNMESLYKEKYCGACHNGKKAFASDTQCARCHVRVKGMGPQQDMPVYKTSETFGKGKQAVRYNHEIHTKNLKCSTCHPKLFNVKKGADIITMADHGKQKYCFTCHEGKRAFSWNECSRCHAQLPIPAGVISFGKDEKAVAFQHNTHRARMKCGSCHTKLFPFEKGKTKISFASHSSNQACFSCHKDVEGTAFYGDCNRCHKDRGGSSSIQKGPEPLYYTVEGAGPVTFKHSSHGTFACDTCHPKLFTMKKGATKMVMGDMYRGESCGTCHNGDKAFQAMECAKCHQKQ